NYRNVAHVYVVVVSDVEFSTILEMMILILSLFKNFLFRIVTYSCEKFSLRARNVLSDEERGETDVFAGYEKF
ncbi:MAG: hypothetical protein MI923_23175, partial [Phycisphaerales bacterium]|nr:hypothetical protein [Phycisphaerales bacterium]